MYRGSQEEGQLEVELIRQFYNEPRSFRVDDGMGGYSFETYPELGAEPSNRSSIFDINISAEKQSPFSRAAQNETAKEMYGMGMFNPQMAEPALVCLDMMEFEGKDKVRENVQKGSMLMQQMQQWQQLLLQLDAMLPQLGIAMNAGLAAPEAPAPAPAEGGGAGKKKPGSAEERAARHETDTTLTAKARQKAAKSTSV